MTEITALRPKSYKYLADDDGTKKAKGTKKCGIKKNNINSKIINIT